MEISGTLHLYSGDDRELFFTFDDDVAQELYLSTDFDIDDKETRRVYISVGDDKLISRRTLSFSRKQTEIKVSLCKKTTKENLGSLTRLYDWFAPAGRVRPNVISVVGTLRTLQRNHERIWELALEEPLGLVSPPGLKRRLKAPSKAQRAYVNRREIYEKELSVFGRLAEKRALRVLEAHYPPPRFSCLWRDGYLDSEKAIVREQGIICDIDIWNNIEKRVHCFIEVKAQQVRLRRASPRFYLSSAEWRSFQYAKSKKVDYCIWIVQYEDKEKLIDPHGKIRILECNEILPKWMSPEVLVVSPPANSVRTIAVI